MIEHERIVARRAELGMSQAELARLVGVSQPAIVEIEKGRVRSTKFVRELATALDLKPRDIDPAYLDWTQAIANDGAGELSVYALTPGDAYGEILADPVNSIPRPAQLQRVPGAYALQVPDDAMAPEFEAADILLVNPHHPPISGYSYLFRDDASPSALLRRLKAFDATRWSVVAWTANPTPTSLSRSDWPICHRIIGKFSRG
ncbi:helix-turn-helix domain-containing protein [Methylobacterium hispanicum]|uniref:LexA family transcriptional regulator n=1 Tax=Methylobacterium TaxID=407 RepID=UPI0009E7F94B|nr:MULTISPECIES: LexA family transcriptional regulator [Methylobacterium]